MIVPIVFTGGEFLLAKTGGLYKRAISFLGEKGVQEVTDVTAIVKAAEDAGAVITNEGAVITIKDADYITTIAKTEAGVEIIKAPIQLALYPKVRGVLGSIRSKLIGKYSDKLFAENCLKGLDDVTLAAFEKSPEKLEKYFDELGKEKTVAKVDEELAAFATAGDEIADITTAIVRSGEDFTILANARKLPGTSAGTGKSITGTWLKGTDMNAGLFPKSVADKLRGKTFNNFDEFRQAFWKEVANDPNLIKQFESQQIARMKEGLAPFTKASQQLGGQKNYILHHKTPINQGGGVYDMDNLYIVTPKYHKEVLAPAYHYGYGY